MSVDLMNAAYETALYDLVRAVKWGSGDDRDAAVENAEALLGAAVLDQPLPEIELEAE